MDILLSKTAETEIAKPRIGIFKPAMEKWILYLPLIAIPAFVLERAFNIHWTPLQWKISFFLAASLGLSSLHNYLTLVMLVTLPEFKNWWSEQKTKRPFLFSFRIYVVTLAIILFHFLIYEVIKAPNDLIYFTGITFLIVAIHHNLAQCLGLSQAYTAKIFQQSDLVEEERTQLLRYQSAEIFLKKILIFAHTLRSASILCSLKTSLSQLFPFDLQILTNLLTVFVVASTILFLLNCALINSIRRSNKLIFSLRLILYSLVTANSSSLALIFLIRTFHALEYWGVCQMMVSKSKISPFKKLRFWRWVFAICVFAIVILLFRKDSGFFYFFAPYHWSVPLLGILSVSVANVHFFLDSLLFKMRDPISRKWMGPLFSRD